MGEDDGSDGGLLFSGIVRAKPTMCLLDGNVEIARLKVAGAVCAMSLWHWKESIVLLGARIVAMVCWLSSV